MKSYIGESWASDDMGFNCVVVSDEQGTHKLDPRLDLCRHSPTGFAWGYGGSGPSQLALAIIADHMGKAKGQPERALRVYQQFKAAFIATLKQNEGFTIAATQIEEWLKRTGL